MSENDKQEVTSLVVSTLMKFEEEKLQMENDRPWFKKPIGTIVIGVSIMLLATGIITFFTSFQGSQKGLIQVQSEIKNNTEATIRNTNAIEKVDGKVEKIDGKINDTDKEWRDAVNEFYKNNPQTRDNKKL